MDYFLTEEQQFMRDVAKEIAEKKIRPVAEHTTAEATSSRGRSSRRSPRPTSSACSYPKNTAAWRRHPDHEYVHRHRGAVQGVRRHLARLRRHRAGHVPDPHLRQAKSRSRSGCREIADGTSWPRSA